jgi:hypothetical protein
MIVVNASPDVYVWCCLTFFDSSEIVSIVCTFFFCYIICQCVADYSQSSRVARPWNETRVHFFLLLFSLFFRFLRQVFFSRCPLYSFATRMSLTFCRCHWRKREREKLVVVRAVYYKRRGGAAATAM